MPRKVKTISSAKLPLSASWPTTKKATTPAERLIVLAPGKRKVVKPEQIAWLHDYLAHYPQAKWVQHERGVCGFLRRSAMPDKPLMLAAQPSYDEVAICDVGKPPEIVKQRGRKTGRQQISPAGRVYPPRLGPVYRLTTSRLATVTE